MKHCTTLPDHLTELIHVSPICVPKGLFVRRTSLESRCRQHYPLWVDWISTLYWVQSATECHTCPCNSVYSQVFAVVLHIFWTSASDNLLEWLANALSSSSLNQCIVNKPIAARAYLDRSSSWVSLRLISQKLRSIACSQGEYSAEKRRKTPNLLAVTQRASE